MRQLPIYSAERDVGLAEILSSPSHGSLDFDCKVLIPKVEMSDEQRQKALAYVKDGPNALALATNQNQFDLFYLNTILVTVGWNKNDDVFVKNEVWASRNTPEDKPFNFEHNPRITIGHITGSCVIDAEGTTIANDTAVDELPDKFHVLTNAVIYRHINSKDEELEKQIAGLIQGIEQGKWFVSMEALFSDFDYAVSHASGKQEILARTNDTAFLTKHLRVYGGKGVFHDKKIGRAVKNVTFSGKGLVETPANPESIIFDTVEPFSGVFANASDFHDFKTEPSHKELIKMADTNDTVALQASVTELKAQLSQLGAEKIQAKYDGYEATIASHTSELGDFAEAVAKLEADLNSIGAKVVTLEATEKDLTEKLEASEKTLAEKQTELDGIAAEALSANRVSALVDKGVDKVEAEKITAQFSGINDEQFEAIVDTQAALVEAAKDKPAFLKKGDDEDKDEKKKEKAKASALAETKAAEAALEAAKAAEEALENAEASDEATLGTPGETEGEVKEQLVASLSDYFGDVNDTNESE